MKTDRPLTDRATWQCPHCGERHHDGFDTCWKCGSDPAGNRDPGFHIAEPVREQDQSPNSQTQYTQLPSLQLPAVTYFSIPPCIWVFLIWMVNDLERHLVIRMPDFSWSRAEILFYCFATVFIGIPMFVTLVRAAYLRIIRRQKMENVLAELLWELSMLKLPESVMRSQRWFVPVYYGSLGALVIAYVGFCAWLLIQSRWLLIQST